MKLKQIMERGRGLVASVGDSNYADTGHNRRLSDFSADNFPAIDDGVKVLVETIRNAYAVAKPGPYETDEVMEILKAGLDATGYSQEGFEWVDKKCEAKVQPLLEENRELKERVEGLIDTNCEYLERIELGTINYELKHERDTLQEENRRLAGMNAFLNDAMDKQKEFIEKGINRELENKRLKSLLREAREVVAFYADEDNWDDHITPTIWDDGDVELGKRARAILPKLDVVMKGSEDV